MVKPTEINFRKPPSGQIRFFSGGHLDGLRQHLIPEGKVDFGRLWVRTDEPPESSLQRSVRFTFVRAMAAKKDGELFGAKVVITGIVPVERVIRDGGMNDETESIKGPVSLDGVFRVSGSYKDPSVEDITLQIFRSR